MAEIAALSEAQAGRCALCGHPLTAAALECDHIVPIARGGADVPNNRRLVHATCNRARGAKL
jgi:5-methylcytosine-specific restriction protein A